MASPELKKYMNELVDYTERLVRSYISDLPDGEAEFTDWNDDDGVGGGPVKLHVKLTVKGDEIVSPILPARLRKWAGRCTQITGSRRR